MGRMTDTVKTLIIINVVIYFLTHKIDKSGVLFANLAMWFPLDTNFRVWQIISHMFMHQDFMHILFNMFNLYIFGSILEQHLGVKRFLFLYFSAGLGGLGLHLLFDYVEFFKNYDVYMQISHNIFGYMVGASGAVFGLTAAFAMLFPDMKLMIIPIPFPIKAKYLIGGYVAVELFLALTGTSFLGMSNIAHWAHLGGALIGFIMIWYWKKNSFNDRRWN